MDKNELYVITGVSGRTGSAVAHSLLSAGKRVRVVVRNEAQGSVWVNQGAEVAIANFTNMSALSTALSGATGAYIISPQQYTFNDLFAQAEIMANTIAEAATRVQLPKLVALSSIGADRSTGTGWIAMNRVLEKYLSQTGLPVTFLRAAYFMENWSPMVKAAAQGELPSFLAPLERKLPMIATKDVGRIAAEALYESWDKQRVIELEGPEVYSPNNVAESLTQALGMPIRAVTIPESGWAEALSDSGFSATALGGFVEMTQGLNSGHIDFGKNMGLKEMDIDRRKGTISLDSFVNKMVTSQ